MKVVLCILISFWIGCFVHLALEWVLFKKGELSHDPATDQ